MPSKLRTVSTLSPGRGASPADAPLAELVHEQQLRRQVVLLHDLGERLRDLVHLVGADLPLRLPRDALAADVPLGVEREVDVGLGEPGPSTLSSLRNVDRPGWMSRTSRAPTAAPGRDRSGSPPGPGASVAAVGAAARGREYRDRSKAPPPAGRPSLRTGPTASPASSPRPPAASCRGSSLPSAARRRGRRSAAPGAAAGRPGGRGDRGAEAAPGPAREARNRSVAASIEPCVGSAAPAAGSASAAATAATADENGSGSPIESLNTANRLTLRFSFRRRRVLPRGARYGQA